MFPLVIFIAIVCNQLKATASAPRVHFPVRNYLTDVAIDLHNHSRSWGCAITSPRKQSHIGLVNMAQLWNSRFLLEPPCSFIARPGAQPPPDYKQSCIWSCGPDPTSVPQS